MGSVGHGKVWLQRGGLSLGLSVWRLVLTPARPQGPAASSAVSPGPLHTDQSLLPF